MKASVYPRFDTNGNVAIDPKTGEPHPYKVGETAIERLATNVAKLIWALLGTPGPEQICSRVYPAKARGYQNTLRQRATLGQVAMETIGDDGQPIGKVPTDAQYARAIYRIAPQLVGLEPCTKGTLQQRGDASRFGLGPAQGEGREDFELRCAAQSNYNELLGKFMRTYLPTEEWGDKTPRNWREAYEKCRERAGLAKPEPQAQATTENDAAA